VKAKLGKTTYSTVNKKQTWIGRASWKFTVIL